MCAKQLIVDTATLHQTLSSLVLSELLSSAFHCLDFTTEPQYIDNSIYFTWLIFQLNIVQQTGGWTMG